MGKKSDRPPPFVGPCLQPGFDPEPPTPPTNTEPPELPSDEEPSVGPCLSLIRKPGALPENRKPIDDAPSQRKVLERLEDRLPDDVKARVGLGKKKKKAKKKV
ncbi:MAG TPA: hypothetical protein VGK67_02695 [Myxococcales bacterium]|jgi:hypothetical protein